MKLLQVTDQILEHEPGFLGRDTADRLLQRVLAETQWRQNDIRMFGKWLKEPRLTAWFGPAYSYSSISWPAAPMPGYLQTLAGELTAKRKFEFNAVLINRYRDGNDGMGWHRDNETEIDQGLIASLSLGATRRFSVKALEGGNAIHVDLAHGDALFMENLQDDWKHQLPKTKKAVGERINLTFRRIR